MVISAEPSHSSGLAVLTLPKDFEDRIQGVIKRWKEIPENCSESNLESYLVIPMLEACGFQFPLVQTKKTVASGLIPDMLVYRDQNQPPILVIENKRRIKKLAEADEANFEDACYQLRPSLYKDAVGYNAPEENGIRQYLDNLYVPDKFLAPYGLVFNGDFFQIWRRVDGLLFPLTPVQKVTGESLPILMRQLASCLHNPVSALVATIWNQKGGVAKTTNTINVGATLALEGKRVLLIDLDTQGDLSRGLGIKGEQPIDYLTPCTDRIEQGETEQALEFLKNAIHVRSFPTTDHQKYSVAVLPCNPDSVDAFRKNKQLESIFIKLINLLKSEYDYIFIDIAPALNELARSVLYVCDVALIPIDLGGKALHHAINLHQSVIPKVRKFRKSSSLGYAPWSLGLVFSNCPTESSVILKKAIDQELQKHNFTGRQYKSQLYTYAQTKIAEFKGVPVISWQNSPIARCYTELTKEVFLKPNFID